MEELPPPYVCIELGTRQNNNPTVGENVNFYETECTSTGSHKCQAFTVIWFLFFIIGVASIIYGTCYIVHSIQESFYRRILAECLVTTLEKAKMTKLKS